MSLQLPLLIAPLAAGFLALLAVRMSPRRTVATRGLPHPSPTVGDALITLGALCLFVATTHSRPAIYYVTIVPFALAAAMIGRWNVERMMRHVVGHYVNPEAWVDLDKRGGEWRYEMKSSFIDDPEFVDLIAFELFDAHPTYESFREAVTAEKLPSSYERVLDRHLWGLLLPTTRELITRALIAEIFENTGHYSCGKSAEGIYEELRGLRRHREAFMDRWQYYWTIRNLNALERIFGRVFGNALELVFFTIAAVVFALLDVGFGPDGDAALIGVRALSAAALLWVVVICGGTNFVLVQLFRGTGTFAIDLPLRDRRQDPLWPRFVRIGIYGFAASFLFYGIGMPILLTPSLWTHFKVDRHFLLLALLSFLLCALIFANHIRAIHELMSNSRANALDRVARRLVEATNETSYARARERFAELRELTSWPLNSAVTGAVVTGIVLPVLVQLLLILAGLA